MITPTRNDVAHYRNPAKRRDLLSEVREWLDGLPSGDLATALRALEWLRGPVSHSDVRFAAGRFYVLGSDALWKLDDERNSLTRQWLQAWASSECAIVETYDRELRAAHEANSADGGNEEFSDAYDKVRARFNNVARRWRNTVQSNAQRARILDDLSGTSGVFLDSPRVFDGNPDVLAVANGLLDLRTGKLRPLRAEDYATQRIEVAYRPEAQAPQWEAFLADIFILDGATREPDTGLIEWIRRLIGYGITGHTREQSFAVFHGKGSNGKGVFTKLLGQVFAQITKTAAMTSFEQQPGGRGASGDIARLDGARLVTTSEGEVGARLSAAFIKNVTGEDSITARHLYRPEFEFDPQFLILMSTNARPSVVDASEGFWRRVKLVPFRRYFAIRERDVQLKQRLWDEREGILAWAVAGAIEWYHDGLGTCLTVDAETSAYRDASDRLGDFIRDLLERADSAEKVSVVIKAYKAWSDDEGETRPLGRTAFLEAMAERGHRAAEDSNLKQKVFRSVRVVSPQEREAREAAAARASRSGDGPPKVL